MAYSSPTENQGIGVAVFDFDGTLVYGDSLWPFLTAVTGWPLALGALAEALILLGMRYAQNKTAAELADSRTFIKAHLLRRLLKGKSAEQLAPALKQLQEWLRWNDQVKRTLLEHHARGHRIVIATGALDLYIKELLKDIPYDAVLCTRMDIKDGCMTGEMLSGNCVRERKAEIVGHYLTAQGAFAESWGYGNYPHDVPMLNLLKHRIII